MRDTGNSADSAKRPWTLSLFPRYVFNSKLDFHVQLFNVLATVGVIVSLLSALVSFVSGDSPWAYGSYMLYAVLSLGLLLYATKTERYQLCYKITIAAVFLVGFTYFFWQGGGYYGAMPYFFVFAVVFTVFMLEGRSAIWFSVIELTAYILLCIYMHMYHDASGVMMDDSYVFMETLFGFSVVSIALGAALIIHFRLHNRQRRELENAREEAIRLSEVKNVFLANMSHEIRTPINVMLGMNEMILRDSRDETVNGYARKVQNAGNMLLVLVSNILDVSKVESGTLEITEERYDIADLVQELYEMGAQGARKKGLSFTLRTGEGMPSELSGDYLRIKQIVSNFLSNAIKYTESGSVTLDIELRASNIGGAVVFYAAVTDSGIGIKEENLSVLFDAFTRIDMPSHRVIEGTGLGLAIAKDLTERMGGHIHVRSVYGEGSTFWVEIPQRVLNEQPARDWRQVREHVEDDVFDSFIAPDASILVVDDNADNLLTVSALLRRTFARVDAVESGAQCIEAVKNNTYHIILMDYMMPDMDGVQTLRCLHEGFPGFATPVIALTANVFSGTEALLLDEGFTAYLTKPVRARLLEETIKAHLPPSLVTMTPRGSRAWATPELIETVARDLAPRGVLLEDGLENAGGDLSLLARMAEVFVRNYPDALSRMKAAYPSDEEPRTLDDLRHLTHSLKSSAGFLGASNLSFTAGRVEQGCAQGDGESVALAMPLLMLEWARAREGLDAFAGHIRAVEPLDEGKAADTFSPGRLAGYIERRARRKAIQELDLLIAQEGCECPHALGEAKQLLMELDFVNAKRLLASHGVWEAHVHG